MFVCEFLLTNAALWPDHRVWHATQVASGIEPWPWRRRLHRAITFLVRACVQGAAIRSKRETGCRMEFDGTCSRLGWQSARGATKIQLQTVRFGRRPDPVLLGRSARDRKDHATRESPATKLGKIPRLGLACTIAHGKLACSNVLIARMIERSLACCSFQSFLSFLSGTT